MMRVNLSPVGAKNHKVKFVTALMRVFCEENDITFGNGNIVKSWFASPEGAKELAAWGLKRGYDIRYWCMEPLKVKNDNSTTIYWVGFGVDIDETNPKIVELKLKN